MAKIKVEIVEGWTGPLDFELLSDGALQNVTAMGVTARALDRDKSVVDMSSDLTVVTATAGLVRLTPDTADFYASGSPYELRFKATDSAGGIVYYPSGEAITLIVRP